MSPAHISTGILDVIFPALCPACHRQITSTLCTDCQSHIPTVNNPCPKCGGPRHNEETCSYCHGRGIPGVRAVFTPHAYKGVVRSLILSAKIKSRNSARKALCALLPVDDLLTLKIDAVCPIPPSPGRRYGPHLATQLAKYCAQQLNCPLIRSLKQRHLPAAQHELPAHLRKHNTQHLFIARNINYPKTVLLVDDVITSGNTIQAAAACLRAQDVKTIYACASGRTIN